jgi:hypothetical protein
MESTANTVSAIYLKVAGFPYILVNQVDKVVKEIEAPFSITRISNFLFKPIVCCVG